MKTLNQLRDEIHEYAINKGFWDKERETGTLLMLCVSELAEAMEADRNGLYADLELIEKDKEDFIDFKWSFKNSIKDTFEDELADAIVHIYPICGLCGARGIDIDKHIELKMKYNATRERLHGKKY